MIKEVLIIRLSSIGDVMHCTPVARAIKTAWPECRITWLVGEVCADLIKYNPYVDEYIVGSKERFEKHLKRCEFKKAWSMWQDLIARLSAKQFYAVLDVHGLFLTGVIAKKMKVERRIGLYDARELNSLFMTETGQSTGRHITDRYLSVLGPLGIIPNNNDMTLVVPDSAKRFAADFLKQVDVIPGEKVVVLVPGTTWPSKNWPSEFFAITASLLASDFKIILCGGKSEIAVGLEIEAQAKATVINAIGQTSLLEMAALLERASVIVAGDTGPLYIAAALNVPTVAIFGPTDPANYKPPGDRSAAVFNQQECSFCHKHKCPTGKADCMKNVSPQEVVKKVYHLESRDRDK